MPNDIRQISFTSEETISAIIQFGRRRGLPMPIGTTTGLIVDDGPMLSAVLIVQDASGRKNEFRLFGENLAAALILFCHEKRIPLPSESDKKLKRVASDSVALIVIKRHAV